MVQYIFTIQKQHSVNKVHTLRYNVSKISRGVVFSYSLVYTAPHIMVFGAVFGIEFVKKLPIGPFSQILIDVDVFEPCKLG